MSQRPIIITAVGSAGDLHPHLGLARALQQRGHQVSVLTSPNYRDAVDQAGIEYVGCGSLELLAEVLLDRRVWHAKKGFAGIWPMVNDMMRHSLRHIEARRAQQPLLIGSPLAFGPRLAAEKYRLPFVATQLAPSIFMSAYDPPTYRDTGFVHWLSPKWRRKLWSMVEDQYIDRICQPDLNGLRERLGLAPVCNVFTGWANHGDLVLCPFPEWFAAPQPDWPGKSRLVGFPLYDESGQHPLDEELQQFLARPEPLVVFCPGSAMAQSAGFFRNAAQVCRQLPVKGIFLTRFETQLPPLPGNVLHRSYLPFSQVLPRAAALVHHGGIGSAAQAFRAGIPQLVLPMAHDQFDNANRVQSLGCGSVLKWGSGPRRFARQLQQLLASPDIRQQARHIASQFGDTRHGLLQACEAVEALL